MTSSARPPEPPAIAVFAKAPVAGAVKTRLAPRLASADAAKLHASLVRHALRAAVAACPGRVTLWCAPDAADPFFAGCAAEFGVGLRAQEGADLGARMRHAFEASLAAGPLLLIGTDCPALDAAALRRAADALQGRDAVLAPAEDGGYALVGLTRLVPGLFDGIPWGGAEVMAATRERLAGAGARWTELPTTWDVDRPEDYDRLCREGWLAGLPA
jgi:uncharacterized protein